MFAATFALLLAFPGAPGEPRARLDCAPRRAEIGQPVEWTLVVDAPAGSTVLLPEQDPALDASWVLLEPRRVERDEGAGAFELRARWTLASLEPGSRTPWSFELPVETPAGRVTLRAETTALEVLPALAADEDAPRPLKSYLPPPPAPASRWWWAGAAAALVALALSAWLWRRRAERLRRARAAAAVPGALARLSTLEQALLNQPERVREHVFELTRFVRERTDRWLSLERSALTDEDWSRALSADERVPLGVRTASARLLERSAAIKYALATPSPFLAQELCADARGVVETLEQTPAPAPVPAAPAEVAA